MNASHFFLILFLFPSRCQSLISAFVCFLFSSHFFFALFLFVFFRVIFVFHVLCEFGHIFLLGIRLHIFIYLFVYLFSYLFIYFIYLFIHLFVYFCLCSRLDSSFTLSSILFFFFFFLSFPLFPLTQVETLT